ncbi:hypothetical protein GZH47_02890 [Paenibacillus rhizovicinus]|uniref:Lipoprotein n=1 Tax=Paenibacillus rhizovicinus TaxID=2704463 RepID=A0A6C0NUK5_9BACL|nr:hypothetical protein [Paenibacillus rhizovicinus]QHW29880.1 hypothetical protein GZH47_02890 [Paenibacillus rhizovicinus]
MRRHVWFPLFLCLVVLGLAGCSSATSRDGTPAPESAVPVTSVSWTPDRHPPMPEMTINGRPAEMDLVSYSWCPPEGKGSCTSIELSIATAIMTHASAGSKLDVKQPDGAKTCTLLNEDKGFTGDPYVVPGTKGVYHYSIHCDWTSNQGKSTYSFAIEVV